MLTVKNLFRLMPALALLLLGWNAHAQSFRVQCPTSTKLHPLVNASGQIPTDSGAVGPFDRANPHIKCQQIGGGDGFATMADGSQTYLFSFGPLSGLSNIVNGKPGTVTAAEFNQSNLDLQGNVLDAVKIGAPDGPGYSFNGAVGLVPDVEGAGAGVSLQAAVLDASVDSISVVASGSGYPGPTIPVYIAPPPCALAPGTCVQAIATAAVDPVSGGITSVTVTNAGNGYTSPPSATVVGPSVLTGHVDPRLIMDVGVLNGNIPAPMISIEEGDELFLTLTNVGMVMRPDLFEQHTVHFHGYPNASAFYDGVPDASVAINIGGSFTYYYLAPEAGTYMWHCHISPPEHLQMGMVGQLYVTPRQNNSTGSLKAFSVAAQTSVDTKCSSSDLLCSTQVPAIDTGATAAIGKMYAYNDGDGSTAYDVEYPIQMHGFDPNFHFVGMTFNPESFVDNKDKYFLLNGRSYPDTVNPAPLSTQASDGTPHFSQPLSALISIPFGGKALVRLSDLNTTEYHTLASLGIPMHVVGYNARLLRDQEGNNMDYLTNSITLAGGESVDVILDASCKVRADDGSCTATFVGGEVFYLYTPQLDHLANDAENFGGMMTEVRICKPGKFDAATKACTQ